MRYPHGASRRQFVSLLSTISVDNAGTIARRPDRLPGAPHFRCRRRSHLRSHRRF